SMWSMTASASSIESCNGSWTSILDERGPLPAGASTRMRNCFARACRAQRRRRFVENTRITGTAYLLRIQAELSLHQRNLGLLNRRLGDHVESNDLCFLAFE